MYEQMYVVVQSKAISLDEVGSPIICNTTTEDNIIYIDWDTADDIDWLDLSPSTYTIYKNAVDFLQLHSSSICYVK